jgi:hypothetical protein
LRATEATATLIVSPRVVTTGEHRPDLLNHYGSSVFFNLTRLKNCRFRATQSQT